ncbi:MAG TPA: aspartate aminotransferase family protein [Candidatus Dormibacteraeota bacterium]|nr:aspartate aminotransferase family protein [Candidatus Dormibacteraeota bacterium]
MSASTSLPDPAPRSRALYRRALLTMPGGNTRTTVFHPPHPLYARRGRGCRVVDADGVERIDFLNNYTALVHGHAHPHIVAAASEQLALGTCFSMPTEAEIELAEEICRRLDSVEQVRFAGSGSEAVMLAVKVARAVTGRSVIAKCEGAYHGSYDAVEVSVEPPPEAWGEPDPVTVPVAQGTPAGVLQDVVVIPFNDAEAAERILAPRRSELAAVIVDPLPNRVGLIPARPDFLAMLRRFTREAGALLVFDEVISFRIDPGGAQRAFDTTPDLTVLGKVIGGGFPIGALGGPAELLRVFDPRSGRPAVPHGGTFNANPVAMAAGRAALELLTPEAHRRLAVLGERARSLLNDAYRTAGVPGQATGMASLIKLHFRPGPLTDYRSAWPGSWERQAMAAVFRHLLGSGILISPSGLLCLSTPMGEGEVEELARAFRRALDRLPPTTGARR